MEIAGQNARIPISEDPFTEEISATGGGAVLAQTPEEAEFWRILQSLEIVPVRNRERFLDSLAPWGFYKVQQSNC
jgi:hypothetical protein